MLSKKQVKNILLTFSFFLFASFIHPFHFHPYRTYYHDVLTVFGLLILFGYLAKNKESVLIFPKLLFLPLGIAFFVLIQILFGFVIFPNDLMLPFMYFFLFGLAIIVGATYAKENNGIDAICLAVSAAHLLAGLLSVVMEMMQVMGINAIPFVMFISRDAQPFMRPYANVAQPNQLALLLCFSLASIWWLYHRQLLSKWASGLLVSVILWGLALTQSRIGWLIVPIFGLISLFRVEGDRLIHKQFLLCMVLIYISFVISLPSLSHFLGFTSGSLEEHVSGRSERMVLMQQAWRMASQHPWFGIGWFGFTAEQVRIGADFSAATYAEHSHNLLLNFAAELGWPATVLIFLFLTLWYVKSSLMNKITIAGRFATLFFAAAFIHSLVEFPLWYAYFLIPIGVLMGMVHQQRWPSTGVIVKQWPIATGFMLSCTVLALVTLDYQRVSFGFKVMRREQMGYQVDTKAMDQPRFTAFPQFFDYFKFSKLRVHERMLDSDISLAEHTSQRFGYAHFLNKLAEIYVLNGQPEKASRTMLTLQRLHPIVYPEYYDYWKAQAALDARYAAIFKAMPPRDAP
ncbi:Wzy polymerase domain-containing protein [Undibacterium sp. Jales W-56]|uniref:PglL family O-oligosaccharyltransferase n=1 Tax=Undibacterium sp. Jales W-56 TaxID=2897325 RepID=UPI0021D1A294|nr:O-antigen ligase family protein [Undibacterium sp. Jales W-56]MCU6434550.1 Wzy polymerase domain-containing protein [Undibacterium sp. Jales W-56]